MHTCRSTRIHNVDTTVATTMRDVRIGNSHNTIRVCAVWIDTTNIFEGDKIVVRCYKLKQKKDGKNKIKKIRRYRLGAECSDRFFRSMVHIRSGSLFLCRFENVAYSFARMSSTLCTQMTHQKYIRHILSRFGWNERASDCKRMWQSHSARINKQ